jgi:PAS domain S-box-containing protein
MDTLYTITLVTNGLTLALALVLLLLVLWQDPRSPRNQFFAVFLLMVGLWAGGSLLARSAAFVGADVSLIRWGLRLLEFGFTGSGVALYMFTVALTGARGRLFRVVSAAGILLALIYQVLVLSVRAYELHQGAGLSALRYEFQPVSLAFYLLFELASVYLVWRYRRKIRENVLVAGTFMFVAGQVIDLLSPELRAAGLSVTVSAPAAMVMSYAVVRQQVMNPLLGRASQLEAVRKVGLAITSRLDLAEVLSGIAGQAADLVKADGAVIFLRRDGYLELAAVHNLPGVFLGTRLEIGRGVAGQVAARRRSLNFDDFSRWEGEADLPLARETFGALMGVPLIFSEEVMGVLEVMEGRWGRVFNEEDLRLLELLAPQAAVAIANGRLFERQRSLAGELSAAKSQLETVLASTESPVVAVDRQTRILLANPAALSLLPDPSVEVEGRRLTDLAPSDFLPPDVRAALRDLRRGRVHTYEVHHQGGTYLCHLAVLGRPNPKGWVAVLNDVTQLKELDRLKSEMVRITSHDLKNPLFAAMSYLELLEEDGESIFDENLREYVGIINHQLERMNRIISGILDLERVQSGTPAYETCNLNRLLRLAAGELEGQAIAKNLALALDLPADLPSVLGDPQQLSQVFINVIDNAVKFTPDGGRVDVRASEGDGQVLVEVADTGIGIPAEAKDRIFERFYRAHQPGTEHISGSGLGLSLAKAIVDAHGGEIQVESEAGVGSTFRVILPVARTEL